MNGIAVTEKPKILERLEGTTNKKKRAGEGRRIEMLGTMDDRRKQALGLGNKAALMVLASEYAALGCPNTATQIMAEAMNLS